MKQRITVKQLNELSEEHYEKIHQWRKPQVGDFYVWHRQGTKTTDEERLSTSNVGPWDDPEANLIAVPLLSIGQMIEIIQDKKPLLKGISKNRFDKWFINIDTAMLGYKDELCDALWEATKQLLKG
jgi:hypothetical protein